MSTLEVPDARTDRARGALLGLAAGDRNGGPVRMAVLLAESLTQVERFDPMDVLRRYLGWFREGAFDTGPVTWRVLELVGRGVDPVEAVRRTDAELRGRTGGCNPAHRVAPLGMAGFVPLDGLAEVARREAALTHAHPLAGEVSAAVAVLIRRLIEDPDLDRALEAAGEGRLPEVRRALNGASPSPGGFAPEALEAAIHFLRNAGGFSDALESSLRFAGPANYCPVLVGAIGGARWGSQTMPDDALAHCAILDRVARVADSLARR